MKTLMISGLASLMLFTACRSGIKNNDAKENLPEPLQGELSISGAEALFPLMTVLSSEFMKIHPGLNIRVAKGGTGIGLQNLTNGKADLAMVSRELTPDEESRGLWFFPVTKEGILPVVGKNNPFLAGIMEKGVKRNDLKMLYRYETGMTWGHILSVDSKEPVIPLTRADSSGAAVVWGNYLGIPGTELLGVKVKGDEGMIQMLQNEPLSLGYCNAHYAFDFLTRAVREGVEVIPLDINNNGRIDANEKFFENLCAGSPASYMGKFPVHLCREISLVSLGKPTDRNTIEFLRWIYTDGQKSAAENGYKGLGHCIADDYLDLLNHSVFK
ncbi:MAG: substrate-binding domain-containing protein [Bacteroidales bacterium]|nr:substrate-binding domain-containing protein [Bacteroidales bacterium]